MSEELWRKITEAPKYEVSNLGNVRNAATGRLMKLNTTTGAPSVLLVNGYKKFRRSVPRLVGVAFDDSEAGERWKNLRDFYMYSISNHGRIKNNQTGRILAVHDNRVLLRDAGYTLSRSVTKLFQEVFGD